MQHERAVMWAVHPGGMRFADSEDAEARAAAGLQAWVLCSASGAALELGMLAKDDYAVLYYIFITHHACMHACPAQVHHHA